MFVYLVLLKSTIILPPQEYTVKNVSGFPLILYVIWMK